MIDPSASLASTTRSNAPVIGELYDLESEEGPRLLFVAAQRIDEACLSAIRDLAASADDAFIIVFHGDEDRGREVEAVEAGADHCLALEPDGAYAFAHVAAIWSGALSPTELCDYGRQEY